MTYSISGHIIDLIQRKIFTGVIHIKQGKIAAIEERSDVEAQYILPGFIDAHIHIESSMLIPSEFARLAVVHGTVATVSDPHEIGNVMGIEGIRYMCTNSKQVPFNIFFGAPSCVPATAFETSGATLSPEDIRKLFEEDHLTYLSEMMNYPGVLNKDPDVLAKIAIALEMNKPVDGHAPGLRGEKAKQYIAAGISTDHECFSLNEALEKIRYGMKILIREGSAAKNYDALHPLIKLHPDRIMFCSDDKHPNDLVKGHINDIVHRSISMGYDLMDVLRAASLNPIQHYKLGIGLLQKEDTADFIIVDNLKDFRIKSTYIQGQKVADQGVSLIPHIATAPMNHFGCSKHKTEQELQIKANGEMIHVIEALPGQLMTNKLILPASIENNHYVSDASRDILKLVVVNRYQNTPPAIGFIKGMGLKKGALASSVAHDSHHIIAVGADEPSLCKAINAIIDSKGGVVAITPGEEIKRLSLPVAGLMSHEDGYQVAQQYSEIKKKAQKLGSCLPDPFMTLSFMALLVIPSLKLSDQGLFDADDFKFLSLGLNIGPVAKVKSRELSLEPKSNSSAHLGIKKKVEKKF